MIVIAWIVLVLSIGEMIIRPFFIGKSIDITPSSSVAGMIRFGLELVIVGRVLGWW